ncbi:hypothetical protein DM480_11145 [Sphingomonas sp. FARSPH]|nr:hypothetical protein DM480_11145 [Sphingomonas sp. FARSPH]
MSVAPSVVAQTGAHSAGVADNPTIQSLFAADQAVRAALTPAQGADRAFVTKMIADDLERRTAARALLDRGALHTGADYYAAAFIFQHGSTPNDYLLAHSLALAGVARGRADATWIAAATLDRYLQAIGQKQIYGTQDTRKRDTPLTMEPYDTTLVPDTLRTALGVPTLAAQQARLAKAAQ